MTTEELRAVTGVIFNVQHYCIHDGPGIRTNVFVKGCPLRCLWCANPESQQPMPQLLLRRDKCVGCGACVKACAQHAPVLMPEAGKVKTDRTLCRGSGDCVSVCPTKAREIMGRVVTAGEVFDEVNGDALFYGADGGVTITGGESLAHPQFTLALLKLCKEAGLNTAVETCGFAKWDVMKPILALCDTVLYDQKQMDTHKHRLYTGQGNELILENLKRANDELDCDIWVRVPTIPGYNADAENMEALALYVKELKHVSQVHLLPFHNMGEAKFEQLENPANGFSSRVPSTEEMEALRDIIRAHGILCK